MSDEIPLQPGDVHQMSERVRTRVSRDSLVGSDSARGLDSVAAIEVAPETPAADPVAWARFAASARNLKAAEADYRAAQQAYAEAVKQLSDEAVK